MKKFLSLLLSVLMIFSVCIFAGAENGHTLSFDDNGEFVILQISDPQDDQHPSPDMIKLIELSIEKSNPDLIVFTGDIVEDSISDNNNSDDEKEREGVIVEGDYEQTLKNVKEACKTIFSPAEKAGIPFAIAQGNNDYKSGITVEDWLKIYSEYEYCLVKDESHDDEKRIDYNLEIKSENSKTAFNLWLMDSGQTQITGQQIDWYKKESDALKVANNGEAVPSIWFQHIQTNDIGLLFEECKWYEKGAKKQGNKYYRLNPDIAEGYFESVMSIPKDTSDVFKAWKNQGDVLGAYFGHMHTEGYTGTYDGIELGFTYGCQFAKDGPYGIRTFTLHEDDIRNYDTELYTYEGSVKKGNARLEQQTTDNSDTLKKALGYFIKAVIILKIVITIIRHM